MIDNYSDTQLRKGFLDLFVLITLRKEQQYASKIISILNEKGIKISEGTLYPLLTRLKNEEYLIYNWEESKSGPPRKYFMITQTGREYLESGLESITQLHNTLQNLIKT